MRNNNPGNIRISGNAWKGKLPADKRTDSAFEQFYLYVFGIRAMIKNLLSYQRDGLNTVRELIYRWAPPSDNNATADYVKFVASVTGIQPGQTIDLKDKGTCSAIVRAMCQMENFGGQSGKPPAVTIEQFNAAWDLV